MALLEINNVSHYFGGLKAVDDFNLTINEGELLGLIGPNGAGKTTIFNLVTGAYVPTEGQIIFQGHPLINRDLSEQKRKTAADVVLGGLQMAGGSPLSELRRIVLSPLVSEGTPPHAINRLGIARTFQTIRLWNQMTVLDNVKVAYHGRITYNLADAFLRLPRYREQEQDIEERALDLLRLFNLERFAQDQVSNLPYGQQRRVEIVRAMASQPKLLLLDEPAAGMNPQEITELMDFIHWIRDEFDLTIWLIEHQMRLVMNICERIKVLDFGATIAEGTPDEIQHNPRVVEAYLGEQMEEL